MKYLLISYYQTINEILKEFELEHYKLSNLRKVLINPQKLLELIKSNRDNFFAIDNGLKKIRDEKQKDLSFLKNPKGYENLSEEQKNVFILFDIYKEVEKKNKKVIDIILLWDNLDYESYKKKTDEEREKYIKNLSLSELEFLFDIY
ncbi:hypothetical protein EOM09_08575 [bacterium]|nr:hypothetical protein [bacterium]